MIFRAMGRRKGRHGTMYPQGPNIDLPQAQITKEALVMIAERWRRRLKCDDVKLFHVVPGRPIRECEVVVRTKGWAD